MHFFIFGRPCDSPVPRQARSRLARVRPMEVRPTATTWAEAEALLAECGASAAMRNSVAMHFWHLKRGLLVRIADGRATLYPLDNARYRAPFALHGPRGEDAFRYCVRTERAWHGNRCRIRRDPRTWALNGPIVDNWAPPRPWTADNRALALARALAAEARPGARYEFMLNVRDYPQLVDPASHGARPWMRHAAAALVGGLPVLPLLPCLSQYTAPGYMDYPLPCAAALREAADAPDGPCAGCALCGALWERRAPRAVFRGSATGPGRLEDNHRVRLVRALARHPGADAALTGGSSRFRALPGGELVAYDPAELRDCVRHGAFVPLDRQAREFRLCFYVEGNAGADRLPALLRRGFAVIVVASRLPALVWLLDGTLRPWEHYIPCPKPEDAPRVLSECSAQPSRVHAIARAGHRAYHDHMAGAALRARFAAALVAPRPPPLLAPAARGKKRSRPRGRGPSGDY